MMKISMLVLILLSVALSMLQFNASQNYVLWLLSVAVTEYGHWLVLIPLIGFLLCIRFATRRNKPKLNLWYAAAAGFVFEMCAILMLLPVIQSNIGIKRWEETLSKPFSPSVKALEKFPDWKRFWFGSFFGSSIQTQTFVYSKHGDEELKLDFYPAKKEGGQAPWVLVIHGGGWDSGARSDFPQLNAWLANKGYAVASIDYRMAPKWTWPAPREDVANAIAYLKSHAKELMIDAENGVVLGRSAGGQIAESAAYQLKDKAIKGCIAFYAPADMEFAYSLGKEDDIIRSPTLIRNYLGGAPAMQTKAYYDASPIYFVSKDSPPTLLFHGPRDPLVWVKQSQRLHAKLQEVGVKSVYIEIPWATHGFDYNLHGPGGQLSTAAIEFFLARVFQAKSSQ